jgi:hypothetical protein
VDIPLHQAQPVILPGHLQRITGEGRDLMPLRQGLFDHQAPGATSCAEDR